MTLIGGVRGIRDGLEAELPQVIASEANRFNVPGIAVAIVSGDNELTATTGVTSVENPVPVDADTLFKVASITKPITGTALMRLAELGRLDFDAPLRTYLPELRLADEEAAAGVTMRHVVTHRVGLMSRSKDFGPGDDALAKWTAHLVDLPQRAKLGELFCYSWDFQLSGRVIEVLTEKTYEDAIHDLVLELRVREFRTLLLLTPAAFEAAVADLLTDMGYLRVKVSGGPGDLAADITCRNADGQRVIVQCKQYALGRTVGSKELQRRGGAAG